MVTPFLPLRKLRRYLLDGGEGWMFRSDNILTETDPEKIRWSLLPDGEHGIRAAEFGSTQEEHNIVPLGGDNLYCVYRTTTGYPCHSYSHDGGHTWTKPVQMTYLPDGGRRIKTPRTCPKLWRISNGNFLFWFHNHSAGSFTTPQSGLDFRRGAERRPHSLVAAGNPALRSGGENRA